MAENPVDIANRVFKGASLDYTAIDVTVEPRRTVDMLHVATLDGDKVDIMYVRESGDNPHMRTNQYFGGTRTVDNTGEILGALEDANIELVPRVYGTFESEDESALVLSPSPVKVHPGEFASLDNYLANEGHTRAAHHNAMTDLGLVFAKINAIAGTHYGSLTDEDNMHSSFGTYLVELVERFDNGFNAEQFGDNFKSVISYGENMVEEVLREGKDHPSRLVLYNQHPKAIFVGYTTGAPVFLNDVEFGQFTDPAVELAGLSFKVFSFYSAEDGEVAKAAFMDGYKMNGGSEDDLPSESLEKLLFWNHYMSAVSDTKYRKDRASWVPTMQDMIVKLSQNDVMDIDAFNDLLRADKFGHPRHPRK